MIQSGDIIRHKRFKDVCCLAQIVLGNVARVKWINMGYVKSFSLGVYDDILVDGDWEICLDPEAVCYRYAAWRPLGV